VFLFSSDQRSHGVDAVLFKIAVIPAFDESVLNNVQSFSMSLSKNARATQAKLYADSFFDLGQRVGCSSHAITRLESCIKASAGDDLADQRNCRPSVLRIAIYRQRFVWHRTPARCRHLAISDRIDLRCAVGTDDSAFFISRLPAFAKHAC
jgi:hypothetical protein